MATPTQTKYEPLRVTKALPAQSEFAAPQVHSVSASYCDGPLSIVLRQHPNIPDCHFVTFRRPDITVALDPKQLLALFHAAGDYLAALANEAR